MQAFLPSILLLALPAGLFAAASQGSFDKSLSVSGTVDLDVMTDAGGITVRQGSAGTVKIHAILKADNGWFGSSDADAHIRELTSNPPIEQNGNRIRVGYVHDESLLKNVSIHLEIETPADTKLRARADSGGIRVAGVHGPVDCKTDSGGIEITDVAASVRAEADSGGIHVRNVKGALFARADSGGIEAMSIAGSIDAQSDSGRMRLEQSLVAPISAKAESGGVTVTLVHGAGYDISADTDSGRISVPEMTAHHSISQHHVEGKVGGGGPMVKIQADSGSVTID
jgi:hypothetical protein